MTEPLADETRSITNGHILLFRKWKVMNHYPAIDILSSVSSVLNQVTEDGHKKIATYYIIEVPVSRAACSHR